jgi:diguanylate cyclase (GGDEF)-like protein
MPTLVVEIRPSEWRKEAEQTFERGILTKWVPPTARFEIRWLSVWGDPMEPSDALVICVYAAGVPEYQSKETITVTLREAVEDGVLPWLSFQNGAFVFDLDILRDGFTILHDYRSLTGRRCVPELFKTVTSYAAALVRTLHYNHLEFAIRLSQNTADAGNVRELEQKFGILFSTRQEEIDFRKWTEADDLRDMQIACLFVDIDDFKRLNTRYTETRIDASVLPEVQRVIERFVIHRGYAYRHGGEEFVILLPNHSTDEAMAFAEELRKTIENTIFMVDQSSERITVSIGVGFFPEHGGQMKDILLRANEAKQAAKNAGRNRVCRATF